MSAPAMLPSWRPGRTRDAVAGFLAAAEALPVEARVAAFDADGTLWCEKPTYVQFDFFEDAVRRRAVEDPAILQRPEFRAVLDLDMAAIGELGLERVALAVVGLFAGIEPAAFTAAARDFMARARHRTLGVPIPATRYLPMLELLGELRKRSFTVYLVSGSGTEFLRALSADLYDVPPELVVGTQVAYEFVRRPDGRPRLLRTGAVIGGANEGEAKVAGIQSQLGRRPILVAGNSAGDREMLEWAVSGDGPGLALLVHHDDREREFAYESVSSTLKEHEPIAAIAGRLGWTVISMKDDWSTVFSR
ncbi:MAG TPA: HAD family hydrolase [Anaeromyxobacteraceae bacterium]|nr:HAD family hydrolase [Anaeromyxobacteraceae bacterium]